MNTGRAAILKRVRAALQTPTDAHVREISALPIVDAESSEAFQQWLPPAGDSYQQRKELFAELSGKLRTEFACVANLEAAQREVRRMSREHSWRRTAYHGTNLAAELANALECESLATDMGYDVDDLEQADVGVTECEALIAQTGSVLITSASSGGRALSVLPPHHLVVARREQLLADLSEGFALLRRKYAGNWPSFSSFITGPSRTGDIERILVLGAHGPKQLTILLIED